LTKYDAKRRSATEVQAERQKKADEKAKKLVTSKAGTLRAAELEHIAREREGQLRRQSGTVDSSLDIPRQRRQRPKDVGSKQGQVHMTKSRIDHS
jgi:hypothetical protein